MLQNVHWSDAPIGVSRAVIEQGSLLIHLDHQQAFDSVLRRVCSSEYAIATDIKMSHSGLAILNCPQLWQEDQACESESLPLHYIRSALLSEHIAHLMEANG